MAATALPISRIDDILNSTAFKLESETQHMYMLTLAPFTSGVFLLMRDSFQMRADFADMADQQRDLIRLLRDDSNSSPLSAAQCAEAASLLSRLVERTNGMLKRNEKMPLILRYFWRKGIAQISYCNDYLASIAESFQIASDMECESLLAITLEAVAG